MKRCQDNHCNGIASALWAVNMTVTGRDLNLTTDVVESQRTFPVLYTDPATHKERRALITSYKITRLMFMCASCGFSKRSAQVVGHS